MESSTCCEALIMSDRSKEPLLKRVRLGGEAEAVDPFTTTPPRETTADEKGRRPCASAMVAGEEDLAGNMI